MSRYSSHDPYLDPASGIPKNRFGITDEPTLEATEASLVAACGRRGGPRRRADASVEDGIGEGRIPDPSVPFRDGQLVGKTATFMRVFPPSAQNVSTGRGRGHRARG